MDDQPEPTLPPAEQMRQKRLAMLNKANPPASTPPQPPSDETPASGAASTAENKSTPVAPKTKDAKTNSSPAPALKPSAANPFSQLGVKNKSDAGSTGQAAAGTASRAHKHKQSEADETPEAVAPPAKKIHVKEESIEEWSDRIIGEVLHVTLDKARAGPKMIFLPNMAEELRETGEPLAFTVQNIDTAILEAASSMPASKPLLNYLLPCFKRVVRAGTTARRLSPEQSAVLDEAKRLSLSNCVFALSMPEYFSREPNPAHDTLVPYLLRHHENEEGVCLEFFDEAIARMKEDDTIAPIFTHAVVQLSRKLATMSMSDDYKPYVNVMVTLSRYPAIVDEIAKHPDYILTPTPDLTKEQIAAGSETTSILGPFFRISPLQPEVTKSYFANPRTMDAGFIKNSQSTLQMSLKAHQGDLASITNAFIRASQPTRNRTLDWFAFIMNTNHKRRALQLDPKDVASDGFMINVTAILDQLCEPFMDATFSKVSKIDVDYFRRNPRIDISDETKLNADQSTSDAFYATKVDGSSNFISEVFFLNLAAHHYGSEAANSRLKELDKDIKHFQKAEKDVAEQLKKLQNDPLRLPLAKRQYDRIVELLEKSMALRYSIEGVLTDKSTQTLSLQFMRYVTVWLLRVASRSAYIPGQMIQLPLAQEEPREFSCLPEYALQDVVDNFKFVLRYMPQIMMSAVGDEIVALCITFLRSSEYIKNPYLKSSLVTVLFAGSYPMYHLTRGILGDILIGAPFANEHLLHALMKFYIECESGTSTAFYDRFNIRYEIFQVVKCIWSNEVYKQKLGQESKVNRQFFVHFVNLLLNDATYLLDEALGKLVKIHDYQKQLLDPALSQEDREKAQTDLEQAEQQCQSWMALVNETISMMKLFTEALTDAFTMPEIVSRLAGMLDYNLESLVGPKRGNLKVEDAKKYNFDAKTLLSDFVDIYLNLGSKASFIEAVAADGRSYKPSNFAEATKIISNRSLKSPEEMAKWQRLIKNVANAKEVADQAELDLGDIPSEFEDPIMGVLMTDPVILPSKAVVDRSTIVTHLLSDGRDPFNRTPMTVEDVVPDEALKARVDAWKAERIAASKAAASETRMDTAED